MFNKIDAWSLPANAIQIVKLFNFVRTLITCNLDIPITTFYELDLHCIFGLLTLKVFVEH